MLRVFKSVGFAVRSEIPLRLNTDREQGKEGRREGRKEKKRIENPKNEKRKNEMKWDSV